MKLHELQPAAGSTTAPKRLGRGVKIVQGRRKGRFELEFYDADDLQRLLEALEQLNFPGK